MKYQGSCHCGGIRFEVEGDFSQVIECNCSMCRRKGSIYPLAEARDKSGKPTAAINVRCLDGIDLGSLKIKQFDGASL